MGLLFGRFLKPIYLHVGCHWSMQIYTYRFFTLGVSCHFMFWSSITWRESVKLITVLKKHKYWMSCYHKIVELLVSLLDFVNIELFYPKII